MAGYSLDLVKLLSIGTARPSSVLCVHIM